jgi:TPR repeat protein
MANSLSPELSQALEEIENGNYSSALKILLPLVERGDPHAQANLATMYQCGWGVPLDAAKAIDLYMKVAERNIKQECLSGVAYHNLATIYATGAPGIPRDEKKVEKFNKLAAQLGFEM